jgi:dTMP kinase
MVKHLNELATGGLRPDITILLDLPPEEAARRAPEKDWQADRLEVEAIEFHRRVREGYRRLAAEEPDRIKLIDGRGSVDEIHEQILILIEPILSSRFPQYDTTGR